MISEFRELSDDETDAVFRALSDSTRRDIVRRVIGHEQSISALAERYTMSFAAVHKHVAVLERSGLVQKRRRGKEQIVRADLDPVRRAGRLLDEFEQLWRSRADRIGDLLSAAPTTATDASASGSTPAEPTTASEPPRKDPS